MSDTNDLVWIELHVEAFGSDADDYVSIPRAEWDAMTEQEREATIADMLDTHIANNVSAGGSEVDAASVPRGYNR